MQFFVESTWKVLLERDVSPAEVAEVAAKAVEVAAKAVELGGSGVGTQSCQVDRFSKGAIF